MTVHPDLVVGLHLADDAGVFRLPDGMLLVQTVDYFTPVVDDPRDWGRIAAANALSDIYAMGGEPMTAMQLIGWPRGTLPFEILDEVIEGGADVLHAAGCALIGGHSIDSPEPMYGFAVTGMVAPDDLLENRGAQVGDKLVLTKPIGTGVISTAHKSGKAPPEVVARAVEVMVALNAGAAAAVRTVGVHAGTDVTGFGLLGHLSEMLAASGVGAKVEVDAVPLIEGARPLAEAGLFPAGSRRNLEAIRPTLVTDGTDETTVRLLTDAQTSGGLLLAVEASKVDRLVDELDRRGSLAAAVVGEVIADDCASIVLAAGS